MKNFAIVAALGAGLFFSASVAQAQTYSWRHHYHHHVHHRYSRSPLGSGTLMNNSNCPAGTQPHVWPNPSGYRCM